jgi:hypothetical protein
MLTGSDIRFWTRESAKPAAGDGDRKLAVAASNEGILVVRPLEHKH